MVASAPPASLGDRHAIFGGGPTSPPPQQQQQQGRSQMQSVDIDSHKDAADDFIEIKVLDDVDSDCRACRISIVEFTSIWFEHTRRCY